MPGMLLQNFTEFVQKFPFSTYAHSDIQTTIGLWFVVLYPFSVLHPLCSPLRSWFFIFFPCTLLLSIVPHFLYVQLFRRVLLSLGELHYLRVSGRSHFCRSFIGYPPVV